MLRQSGGLSAFVCAVASIVCVSGAAEAGDRPFSWTGFYLGAHGGGVSFEDRGDGPLKSDGGLAGLQAGYNFQTGALVFGVEGDVSKAFGTDETKVCGLAATCNHELNWLASLRGRVGTTLLGHRTLLYATGGWAWASIDYTTVNGALVSSDDAKLNGLVFGGGFETLLTEHVSLKIEYLSYRFDETLLPHTGFQEGADVQTVKLGVNYKF